MSESQNTTDTARDETQTTGIWTKDFAIPDAREHIETLFDGQNLLHQINGFIRDGMKSLDFMPNFTCADAAVAHRLYGLGRERLLFLKQSMDRPFLDRITRCEGWTAMTLSLRATCLAVLSFLLQAPHLLYLARTTGDTSAIDELFDKLDPELLHWQGLRLRRRHGVSKSPEYRRLRGLFRDLTGIIARLPRRNTASAATSMIETNSITDRSERPFYHWSVGPTGSFQVVPRPAKVRREAFQSSEEAAAARTGLSLVVAGATEEADDEAHFSDDSVYSSADEVDDVKSHLSLDLDRGYDEVSHNSDHLTIEEVNTAKKLLTVASADIRTCLSLIRAVPQLEAPTEAIAVSLKDYGLKKSAFVRSQVVPFLESLGDRSSPLVDIADLNGKAIALRELGLALQHPRTVWISRERGWMVQEVEAEKELAKGLISEIELALSQEDQLNAQERITILRADIASRNWWSQRRRSQQITARSPVTGLGASSTHGDSRTPTSYSSSTAHTAPSVKRGSSHRSGLSLSTQAANTSRRWFTFGRW